MSLNNRKWFSCGLEELSRDWGFDSDWSAEPSGIGQFEESPGRYFPSELKEIDVCFWSAVGPVRGRTGRGCCKVQRNLESSPTIC
jgi:hypothetical protein